MYNGIRTIYLKINNRPRVIVASCITQCQLTIVGTEIRISGTGVIIVLR